MALSDQQIDNLLERVQAGSSAAVQHLVAEHRPRLRKMVAARIDRRLTARIDPSDVVQDVLIEASQRLPEYAQSRKLPFYPWLRQMAWDRLVELHQQHVRVQKRSVTREAFDRLELSDQSMDAFVAQLRGNAPSPSVEAVRNEMKTRVRAHLQDLDEVTREVLLMHYVEQMKLREIGPVLGLSESAVKSRHIRGLQKLASAIGESEADQ